MFKRAYAKIFPISLRWLLIFVIFLISLIPALIYGRVLTESFAAAEVEERRISLQSQALIITDNIGASAYLRSGQGADHAAVANIDASMKNLANLFGGRILIIDRNYRIIKDTFNLSQGSFHISKEVLRCFKGENTNDYNDKKHYILQTLPIYTETVGTSLGTAAALEDTRSKEIQGVMLIYSSTQGERNILDDTRERMLMLEIILSLLVFGAAIFIASAIVRPLQKLRDSIESATDGILDDHIHVNTYSVTQKISEAINSTFRKLKDINTSRDEFVANVSHELKTPITSIRVLADALMLTEGVTVEQYQDFMSDISNEIDRESKIIDDLLSLVKEDKANMELTTAQVNINHLIEQIIHRLKPIADMRGISIEFASNREVEAEVDEMKLSLAISNLIENAIKYNKEEGFVKVNLDADHKFLYLKVADSGVGIPEELQEAIFERFYRVDKARSRETGGTGLGLAITRTIILRHKGMIKVTSKEGEGSTFLMRIPLTYRR